MSNPTLKFFKRCVLYGRENIPRIPDSVITPNCKNDKALDCINIHDRWQRNYFVIRNNVLSLCEVIKIIRLTIDK